MKTTLTIILLFFSTILFGQNRHLSLGLKRNGICFGNSADYNGIRLNLWDINVTNINGLNISGLSKSQIFNGVSIGIIASIDSIGNGIKIGGLGALAQKYNGLAIGGLFVFAEKINGVGIAGFSPMGDTLNGLFVGFYGVTEWDIDRNIKVINGIAIGGLGVKSRKINGLALGVFYNSFEIQNGVSFSTFNKTKELHGLQFGLLNYAENNRKLFRWTPLINFNFRKNASR